MTGPPGPPSVWRYQLNTAVDVARESPQVSWGAEGATPPRNLSGTATADEGNSGKQAPGAPRPRCKPLTSGEALRLMTEGEAHSDEESPMDRVISHTCPPTRPVGATGMSAPPEDRA
ncbi:hypothetical protein GCM10009634_12100 [Saccharothrix xinjiangensis]